MNVSDKETRAVYLNFKELRCLEKNMQALDLEKSYSMSLITLDQKVLKVHYKHLRDRVSKIKSHLQPDEISNMKSLDEQGKLGVTKSASKMDFNLRIEAASKRLKLLPRSKSAVPRLGNKMGNKSDRTTPRTPVINIDDADLDQPPTFVSNFSVPRSVREQRRKSIIIEDVKDLPTVNSEAIKAKNAADMQTIAAVNGVQRKPSIIKMDAFTRTPSPRESVPSKGSKPNTPRTDTVSFLQVPNETNSDSSKSKAPNAMKIRPVSVPATQISKFNKLPTSTRRSATAKSAQDFRKKSIADTNAATKMLREGRTRSLFSSHDLKETRTKPKIDQPFRSIRDGVMAGIELDSTDNSLGSDLYQEMKKGLILGEVATNLYLEDKIDHFVEEIENYTKANPIGFEKTDVEIKPTTAKLNNEIKNGKSLKPKRNKLRRRQLELQLEDGHGNKSEMSEQVWKDINQCRYLRVPDELIDLSGINTLAVDQMKMFNAMRSGYDESSD